METQKIKIAVVILNWNGKDWLEKFLPTIVRYTTDAEIIIADNSSTDNSLLFLSENFPTIKVISNKENLGFAGGYNKALNQIHAEYYVLLNSYLIFKLKIDLAKLASSKDLVLSVMVNN